MYQAPPELSTSHLFDVAIVILQGALLWIAKDMKERLVRLENIVMRRKFSGGAEDSEDDG